MLVASYRFNKVQLNGNIDYGTAQMQRRTLASKSIASTRIIAN